MEQGLADVPMTSKPLAEAPRKRPLSQAVDAGSSKQSRLTNDASDDASSSRQGPFCDICKRYFKTNYVLKRHCQGQHSSARLACPEPGCSETFTRQDSLDRHVENQHRHGKVKCIGCSKHFRQDFLPEHISAKGHGHCREAYAGHQERYATTQESGDTPYRSEGGPDLYPAGVLCQVAPTDEGEPMLSYRREASMAGAGSDTNTDSESLGRHSHPSSEALAQSSSSSRNTSDHSRSFPIQQASNSGIAAGYLEQTTLGQRMDDEPADSLKALLTRCDALADSLYADGTQAVTLTELRAISLSPTEPCSVQKAACLTSDSANQQTAPQPPLVPSDRVQEPVSCYPEIESQVAQVLPLEESLAPSPLEADSAEKDPERWKSLQLEAARESGEKLSSVKLRVIQHLLSYYDWDVNICSGTACVICGDSLGSDKLGMIQHVDHHHQNPPKPRFRCTTCEIAFVYEADFRLHRQPRARLGQFYQDGVACWEVSAVVSDCDMMAPGHDESWMTTALRDKFLLDLHVWEAFQLLHYVNAVVAAAGENASNGLLRDELRFRQCISVGTLYSTGPPTLRTVQSRSCIANIQMEDKLGVRALTDKLQDLSVGAQRQSCASEIRDCLISLSPLAQSVVSGDFDRFNNILRRGHEHTCPACERYVLHWACKSGDAETVETLPGARPVLKRLDPLALRIALQQGHSNVVELLLKRGGDVTATCDDLASYLGSAVKAGAAKCIEPVLDHILAASNEHEIRDLLFCTVRARHTGAVGLLLRHGANPLPPNGRGWNALHHASAMGDLDMINALLKCNQHSNMKLVNARTCNGWTPMMFALALTHRLESVEIVKALLDHGAIVSLGNAAGDTALDFACRCQSLQAGGKEVAERLVRGAANVNAANRDGWTPLMYASSNGLVFMVHGLLEAGAKVDSADRSGQTALIKVAARTSFSVVRELLAAGADATLEDAGGLCALKHAWDSDIRKLLQAAAKTKKSSGQK